MVASRKLRIAQVVGNATTGGVISCVMNFYRNIDRSRFRFDFFTYGPSTYDEEIRALGGEVYYISDIKKIGKVTKELKSIFSKNRYDAVHAHLTTLSFIPLRAAKKAGIKNRIAHAHSTTHKSEKVWIIKKVFKHFTRRYAKYHAGCSRYACRWLFGKRKGDKAFLLKNAIDMAKFRSSEQKVEAAKLYFGLSGKKVVGHIGRIVFQKNPLFLIDVFNEISKRRDDVVFAMVGDGNMMEQCRERIEKYGLKGKVFIFAESHQVEEFYALFDAFLLPSKFEGLPLVAIEAQAMGLSCFLSDKITREVDVTGQCKFLPIDSATEWADEVVRMMNMPTDYDSWQSVVDAGYDIKLEVKNLEEYYKDIIYNTVRNK